MNAVERKARECAAANGGTARQVSETCWVVDGPMRGVGIPVPEWLFTRDTAAWLRGEDRASVQYIGHVYPNNTN